MLIHLFFSKFVLYRALHFFTNKEINRDYFQISILISKFVRWVFRSCVFFKFWKKNNYFAVIKNFQWAMQLVLTQHKLFSSYCELVLLLQCWSVLAALTLKVAFTSGRFGAPDWPTLMDAGPWDSRYSDTMRRGYKCCLSGFRQWLRCLSRGECLGITLPRQRRDKPARRGEHPTLLLSYRG